MEKFICVGHGELGETGKSHGSDNFTDVEFF